MLVDKEVEELHKDCRGCSVRSVTSFAYNFKVPHKECMWVENLQSKTPSSMESRDLIKPFSLEEVKQAV